MGKNTKIPITGYGKGNCCPQCGSAKVTYIATARVEQEFDLNDKPIYKRYLRDGSCKRIYRPSNSFLASCFESAIYSDWQCIRYQCKKCGWTSDMFLFN